MTWSPAGERWAWAEVDLDAVVHNVAVLRAAVSPAAVWAVVKADGYGHGAVEVARAALDAGAGGLCVALVQEAARLRAAGIDAPILVLSEQPPDQLADAVRLGVVSTVCSTAQLDALEAAGAATHRVHLKVDTGMHRVGCPPEQAVALAQSIERRPALVLVAGRRPPSPTNPPTRSRPGSSPASTRCCPNWRPPASTRAASCRLNSAGARPSAGSPRPRPGRHRRVRGGAGPGCRAPVPRAAAGDVVTGTRLAREAGRRR
ncbi:MAG: alanine racemase [Ilumatobacteraceae bacterium]